VLAASRPRRGRGADGQASRQAGWRFHDRLATTFGIGAVKVAYGVPAGPAAPDLDSPFVGPTVSPRLWSRASQEPRHGAPPGSKTCVSQAPTRSASGTDLARQRQPTSGHPADQHHDQVKLSTSVVLRLGYSPHTLCTCRACRPVLLGRPSSRRGWSAGSPVR
jgi:hypothetical protein